MDYNTYYFSNRKHPGGKPVWVAKHPELYQLMQEAGLRQYDVALICNMHPESLGRKLRTVMKNEEEMEIIKTVEAYLKEHPNAEKQ